MPVEIADGVVVTISIGFSTSAGSNTVPIGANLTSIVYTDVSTYVRDIKIKRGRSNELDDFTTGSCQIILENQDRRFDPENTAGPYYGKLTPGRPIRIEAAAPGDLADTIFQGYIDQWDQQYSNPNDAVAAVTASDAFKILNLITLPSYWDYAINLESPTTWFKLNDGDAPSTALESVSGRSLGTWKNSAGANTTGQSSSSLIRYNSSGAASFNGSEFIELPLGTIPFGNGDATFKTLFMWISTTTTTDGKYGIFYKPGNEATIAVGMVVTGGVGVIQAQWGSAVGVNSATAFTSAVQVNDGKPHFILMTFQVSGGGGTLHVDDVLATTSASFTTSAPTESNVVVGKSFTSSATATYNMTSYFNGVIDEIAFFKDGVLTGDFYADFQTNGAYLGASPSNQMEYALQMCKWMFDGETFSTSTSTLQGMDTEDKTVLAFLKQCEAADQGRLFINREGLVQFISRTTFATNSTSNTSQRTFGDGTGELPYLDLEFSYDDRLIYNRISISRREGATVQIDDTTSQGQYFIRTDSLSGLINDSDRQIDDMARVRLATYKEPKLRIDRMTFSPRRLPSMYSSTITDDIGTRITVKRRPQDVGSAITKELIIEGISHDIGPSSWITSYNLSPAPLPFLILDNNTYGVLDSTNVLGY